ncbi:hypothetical protein IBX73_10525 [candidate division WOR-3 bacterium]|nr:hypothetical protein [candidate division WOR-3 bacterium]
MRRLLIMAMLLCAASYALETVAFEDSWGEHPLFNVVSQDRSGIEIVFSLHEIIVEEIEVNGAPMKNYGVPGIFLFNDEGAPNLPGTGRYIAVPQGAQARLTILGTRTEVHTGVDILPAPNIPKEDDDSPLRYEKNADIYTRNAFYPESPAVISVLDKIRGVDVVTLGFTPFQYNPVTKELVIYKDIRVRIDFVGGNGRFGDDRLRSRFWEPLLQGHLLNYDVLPQIDFYAPERVQARDGFEYIIIVPDDPVFEAWADTIKTWRKLQGISCEVFTLSEVGGSSTTAIENFLNNAYTTWNPAPAAFLLLSDYPNSGDTYGILAPMWTGTGGTCASDNIYADVYGNNLPDMHHGRICAQDEIHLSTMINKFLSYERNPYTAANFYDEPLMACGWQTERWFQLCSEVVRGFLVNGLGKSPVREYAIYSGTPVVGGPWSTASNTSTVVNYFYNLGWLPALTNPYDAAWWSGGSATGINAAINSGAFLIQHRDHGYEYGWGEPDYSTAHLSGLTNEMFVFVNSSNCLTGKYIIPAECFAEKFHRIEYGALSLNAASEVSYSYVNDVYVWGMYDAMWPQFMPAYPVYGAQVPGYFNLRPCMAMSSAKYFLQQSSWPSTPSVKAITYHLFHHHGEAFSVLYSEMPAQLAVTHAPRLITTQTSFQVTANDSAVIALTVNGEIIGVAEGTGSPVSISIAPQPVGSIMKVTVTKFNHYRYECDVPIVPSSYGFPVIATTVLSGMGSNGQINPGETIGYGVYAKNMGTQTLQSVYGLLSVTDPYVSISIDSSWYGTIAEFDSARSTPDYTFTVADNCPDGYTLAFTLEFHDGNDSTWTYHPAFTVHAPQFIFQSVEVVGGAWNNGILDPSETADLVVTVMNEGGAEAENVTATLSSNSPGISVVDNSGSFGTIGSGSTGANAADPFTVYASTGIPFGTLVDFTVVIQSGVCADTVGFSLIVGRSVPTDTNYYYAYYSNGPHGQSPAFNWYAIDSTQTANPGVSLDLNRNQTVVVDLPFTFRYYGIDYDRISICSNGWIAMDSTGLFSYANTSIPNAAGPPAMIAGIWDYLEPGTPGQPGDIYYYHDAANHRFIVEYFMIEHFPMLGYHETFEIILYDPVYFPTPTGDGEILVQYLTGLQLPASVTIGIENETQTVGIQYNYNAVYDSLAVPITDSFAIRYTTIQPTPGIAEHDDLSIAPARTTLMNIHPNPFVSSMSISYQVAARSRVSLRVYDAAGRMVSVLAEGVREPGYYTAAWQGRDDQGRKVPAGVYFVRFDTDDCLKVQKTVLLR